jgi:hypothetical protein
MGKRVTFSGVIDEGLEERIKLSTLNGKTGYRIVDFDAISTEPGNVTYRSVIKVYSKSQGSGGTKVEFDEGDLLGVVYLEDDANPSYAMSQKIIFDEKVFNQDIYVTYGGVQGTTPVSYKITLEKMKLTDLQATQLTLANLRNIASR